MIGAFIIPLCLFVFELIDLAAAVASSCLLRGVCFAP